MVRTGGHREAMILKQRYKLSMIPSTEKLMMGLSGRFWNDKVICNFLGKSFLEE